MIIDSVILGIIFFLLYIPFIIDKRSTSSGILAANDAPITDNPLITPPIIPSKRLSMLLASMPASGAGSGETEVK